MKTAGFVLRSRALLVWFALVVCALPSIAQVDTGTILGTVTDSTGAIVSNARVTIVNLSTSAPQTASTTEDGRYVFTPLPIGTYSVTVEAGGFKKATVQSVRLAVAASRPASPAQAWCNPDR